MQDLEAILRNWSRVELALYIGFVIGLAFLVRAVLALLSALDRPRDRSYSETLGAVFKGCGLYSSSGCELKSPDYWYPFVLGSIELLTYPVLFVLSEWLAVGTWVGLKTVAQWQHWTSHRASFNRFLIGNALVILLSALILAPCVPGPPQSGDTPTLSNAPIPSPWGARQ